MLHKLKNTYTFQDGHQSIIIVPLSLATFCWVDWYSWYYYISYFYIDIVTPPPDPNISNFILKSVQLRCSFGLIKHWPPLTINACLIILILNYVCRWLFYEYSCCEQMFPVLPFAHVLIVVMPVTLTQLLPFRQWYRR